MDTNLLAQSVLKLISLVNEVSELANLIKENLFYK